MSKIDSLGDNMGLDEAAEVQRNSTVNSTDSNEEPVTAEWLLNNWGKRRNVLITVEELDKVIRSLNSGPL